MHPTHYDPDGSQRRAGRGRTDDGTYVGTFGEPFVSTGEWDYRPRHATSEPFVNPELGRQ
jgi:hypothetical protein